MTSTIFICDIIGLSSTNTGVLFMGHTGRDTAHNGFSFFQLQIFPTSFVTCLNIFLSELLFDGEILSPPSLQIFLLAESFSQNYFNSFYTHIAG
jgi:hypothetical protein